MDLAFVNPKLFLTMTNKSKAHDQLEKISTLWNMPLCTAVMLVPNTKPTWALVLFFFCAFLFSKNNGFKHWRRTPSYLMAIFLFHTCLGLSFIFFSFFTINDLKFYLNIYLISLFSCIISTLVFSWLYNKFLKSEKFPFKDDE